VRRERGVGEDIVSEVRVDAWGSGVGFEMGGVQKVLDYVLSEFEMLGVQRGDESRKGLVGKRTH